MFCDFQFREAQLIKTSSTRVAADTVYYQVH